MLLFVCIVVLSIVFYNNRDIFGWSYLTQSSPNEMEQSIPLGEVLELSLPQEMAQDSVREPVVEEVVVVDSIGRSATTATDSVIPDKSRFSLYLPGIRCSLLGRDDLTLHLSVELFSENRDLYEELLFKRDQLRVMVTKVMSRTEYGDVHVSLLKPKVIGAINAVLENGALDDLQFRTFRIE